MKKFSTLDESVVGKVQTERRGVGDSPARRGTRRPSPPCEPHALIPAGSVGRSVRWRWQP